MYEVVNYRNLKHNKSYCIRISSTLGYIMTFIKIIKTPIFIECRNVYAYNFKQNKIEDINQPYKEPCYFSKYDTYLRIVSKEEFMNKLIEVHARNITNKILQTLIDIHFQYEC